MSHPVDPHMVPLLAQLKAARAVDYADMPIAEARELVEAANRPWNVPKPPVSRVEELTVPGASAPMAARLYHPAGQETRPLVVFVHGGGWTFGSLESHDGIARTLANESGCAVLAFEYRLAPEHPFPAGLDDTLAAIAFARGGGLGASVNASRMALSGDSAGANLALSAMLQLKGKASPKTAALFYGCYAPIFDTPSHQRNGDGTYVLGTKGMQWYWKNFLGSEPESTTSLAAPLRADFSGLPPLYLNAAGLDPLLDDTHLLSARLSEAGVRHRVDVFPGVVHGFLRMTRDLPAARQALHAAGEFLSRELK
jgi:acetyl esterase